MPVVLIDGGRSLSVTEYDLRSGFFFAHSTSPSLGGEWRALDLAAGRRRLPLRRHQNPAAFPRRRRDADSRRRRPAGQRRASRRRLRRSENLLRDAGARGKRRGRGAGTSADLVKNRGGGRGSVTPAIRSPLDRFCLADRPSDGVVRPTTCRGDDHVGLHARRFLLLPSGPAIGRGSTGRQRARGGSHEKNSRDRYGHRTNYHT